MSSNIGNFNFLAQNAYQNNMTFGSRVKNPQANENQWANANQVQPQTEGFKLPSTDDLKALFGAQTQPMAHAPEYGKAQQSEIAYVGSLKSKENFMNGLGGTNDIKGIRDDVPLADNICFIA